MDAVIITISIRYVSVLRIVANSAFMTVGVLKGIENIQR